MPFEDKTKEAFKKSVLAHASKHDRAYLQSLFKRQGAALDGPPERSLHDGITCKEWVDLHTCGTGMPFNVWLKFGQPEAIGEIDGQPVYFNRDAGIYGYATAPDAGHLLELWLTSPHYPPGW